MGNARIISIQYNLAASKDQNLECLAISSKAVTNIFFHPTNDTDMSIESRHDQSIGRLFLKKRNNPNKRKVNQQKTLVHWLAWCYLVVNYFSSSRNWLIYKLPDLNVVIQLKQCYGTFLRVSEHHSCLKASIKWMGRCFFVLSYFAALLSFVKNHNASRIGVVRASIWYATHGCC